MPTTTTTTTVTGKEGTTTTTETVTALEPPSGVCEFSAGLVRSTSHVTLLVNAPKEKIGPLIQFSTVLAHEPITLVLGQRVTNGDNVGSERIFEPVAGGPFDGKVAKETCTSSGPFGHSYYLTCDPFGTETCPFPCAVENYESSIWVDDCGDGQSILCYSSHYHTSEPDTVEAMMKGFMDPLFATIAGKVGGDKKTPWPIAPDPRDDSWCGPAGKDGTLNVDPVGAPGCGKRAILVARPVGDIKDTDLKIVDEPMLEPKEGEALVQNIYISMDPTHRIWMSDQAQYMPCVGLGTCMRAGSIGKVVKSSDEAAMPVGTYVSAFGGVQEYTVQPIAALNAVVPGVPLSLNHSLFSAVIGLTAWVGTNICAPATGKTFVVSGAAGAVGSVAGQLAKMRGARVVGIAGGAAKCQLVTEFYGMDAAIDYKNKGETLQQALDRTCPEGVDCYFDNVGGPTLEAVLTKCNNFANVASCGVISEYNNVQPGSEGGNCSLKNFQMLLMRRISVRGFICVDHVAAIGDAMAELTEGYKAGKIKVKEDIQAAGIESYTKVVRRLYSGENSGKLMLKVAEE